MSLGKRKNKSEHAGAKNYSGHWGIREEENRTSKKSRLSNSNSSITAEVERLGATKEGAQP